MPKPEDSTYRLNVVYVGTKSDIKNLESVIQDAIERFFPNVLSARRSTYVGDCCPLFGAVMQLDKRQRLEKQKEEMIEDEI